MEKKQPLVAVIILNWNGYQDTIACINSVRKNIYTNYTIILLDNGSIDGSVFQLQKKFPKIPIIQNKTNEGFARGCNIAAKVAMKNNPDYLLFLNNDTIVDRKWLIELVNFIEKNPSVGICGPKIYLFDKPTTIWFAGGKIDYANGPFLHINQGRKDIGNDFLPKEVDYITGCSLLLRTSVIKKIGTIFREKYFSYVEDIDVNIRVKRSGYRIYFIPTSKVWHKVSASTGGERKANTQKAFYKARNLIYFIKMNYVGKKRKKLLRRCILLKLKEICMWIRYLNLSIPFAMLGGLYHGFVD